MELSFVSVGFYFRERRVLSYLILIHFFFSLSSKIWRLDTAEIFFSNYNKTTIWILLYIHTYVYIFFFFELFSFLVRQRIKRETIRGRVYDFFQLKKFLYRETAVDSRGLRDERDSFFFSLCVLFRVPLIASRICVTLLSAQSICRSKLEIGIPFVVRTTARRICEGAP